MSQVIPEVIFESSFKHRVEMARTKVGDTKDVILFMLVDGIEKGTVTLLGYAIVTEEISNDTDSGAIYSKGKSIYEYFDNVKLHDVLAKYEKAAREEAPSPKPPKRDNTFSRSCNTREDHDARQIKTAHKPQTFSHAL
jgi:hypothetical protein